MNALDRRSVARNDDPKQVTADARDAANESHAGFSVVCQRCGFDGVKLDSDVGFSALSGSWGSVDLTCLRCGLTVALWEA